MPKCKVCPADINWIKTANGRPIPLNPGVVFVTSPIPDDDKSKSTTIVTREGTTIVGTRVTKEHAKFLRDNDITVWEGMIPHHAT